MNSFHTFVIKKCFFFFFIKRGLYPVSVTDGCLFNCSHTACTCCLHLTPQCWYPRLLESDTDDTIPRHLSAMCAMIGEKPHSNSAEVSCGVSVNSLPSDTRLLYDPVRALRGRRRSRTTQVYRLFYSCHTIQSTVMIVGRLLLTEPLWNQNIHTVQSLRLIFGVLKRHQNSHPKDW